MYIFTILILLNYFPFCGADDIYSVLNVFNNNFTGLVAAYGDYNADKNIDIFAISNQGQNIDVWLASVEGSFSHRTVLTNVQPIADTFISGLMVTDFNMDGYLDILSIWKHTGSQKETLLRLFWGHDLNDRFDFPGKFEGEPVLLDFNADMKADILTTSIDTNKVNVWMMNGNSSYDITIFPSSISIKHPHSCAFVQVLGSLNTDLVVTAEKKKFQVFVDGDYNKSEDYTIKNESPIGQSSFSDMDEDAVVDHLLPVGNQIQVYSKGQWRLLANLDPAYSFDYANIVDQGNGISHAIPVTLVMGDYDNDGFTDILTVVKDKNGKHTAILLKNIPCDIERNCVGFGRQLVVQASVLPALSDNLHVHTASFFDYAEDGNLDILLLTSTDNKDLKPVLLKNNIASDTCFMKVTVTSGDEKWPLADRKPYGVNSIGPSVMYETTKFAGEKQSCISTQLTQSAHFSLQQPYILFGLGQTPNFVDTVNITIPQQLHQPARSRVWTQIIPNSQLLVNPSTLDHSSTWSMRLFVMPSKQIFTTTAVLGATCILLAFVVGGLFVVEKREDKAVRSQESQRFHFDAM